MTRYPIPPWPADLAEREAEFDDFADRLAAYHDLAVAAEEPVAEAIRTEPRWQTFLAVLFIALLGFLALLATAD